MNIVFNQYTNIRIVLDSRSISLELNVLNLEIQLCVEWLTKDIEVQWGQLCVTMVSLLLEHPNSGHIMYPVNVYSMFIIKFVLKRFLRSKTVR